MVWHSARRNVNDFGMASSSVDVASLQLKGADMCWSSRLILDLFVLRLANIDKMLFSSDYYCYYYPRFLDREVWAKSVDPDQLVL